MRMKYSSWTSLRDPSTTASWHVILEILFEMKTFPNGKTSFSFPYSTRTPGADQGWRIEVILMAILCYPSQRLIGSLDAI